jgi:hypothetical protein
MTTDEFIKGMRAAIRNGGFTAADVTRALERVRTEKREGMSKAKGDDEFIERLKTMPIQELSRAISDLRDESSIFLVEIRPTNVNGIDVDVQAQGTFNNITTSKVQLLTSLTFALREFTRIYEAELAKETGAPVREPTLGDRFKRHGIKAVAYNPLIVIEAARAVMSIMERNSQRRVIALAVAGLIVRMQAELAGDTLDNTIELMRIFIDNLKRDLTNIPKA